MPSRYQYYKLKLEVLSPVHIGCGTTLSKLDYIFSEQTGLLYVLDPLKLFGGLERCRLLERFGNGLPIETSMTAFITQHGIPENEYKHWAAYSYPVKKSALEQRQCEIQCFLKDAYGMPYIPGSGLKGALHTLWAYGEIVENPKYQNYQERLKDVEQNFGMMKKLRGISSDLERDIFQRKVPDAKDPRAAVQIMSGIQIGDSTPLSRDDLILCAKVDRFLDGSENTLPLLRECLKPSTIVEFDVKVDTTYFPNLWETLAKRGDIMLDDYCARLRDEYDMQPLPEWKPGEILLYLGGGTGFFHKTLISALFDVHGDAADWTAAILNQSFKDHHHPAYTRKTGMSPKALKCTYVGKQLYEMGLCRLTWTEKHI